MPFGDNDWLALTVEPTLEPELPICDPHHHFWDFRAIRIPYQRYLLQELAADINSGHNMRSTVFIEKDSRRPAIASPGRSPSSLPLGKAHGTAGAGRRPVAGHVVHDLHVQVLGGSGDHDPVPDLGAA